MSSDNKKSNEYLSIPYDIMQLTNTIFDNALQIELWLNTPIQALNGDTPINRLKTGDGADEIRAILNKIENGEFT